MGIMKIESQIDRAARAARCAAMTASARATGTVRARMSLATSQETRKRGGHRLQDMADKANHVAEEIVTNAAHATQEFERKAVKSAEDVVTFVGLIQLLLVLAVDRAPGFRHRKDASVLFGATQRTPG